MLGGGVALLVMVGYGVPGGTGWRAPVAGALLAAAIVLYNWHHKANH